MKLILAIIMLTAGCADVGWGTPAPQPHISLSVAPSLAEDAKIAAEMWADFGFSYGDWDPSLPGCIWQWSAEYGADCNFHIKIDVGSTEELGDSIGFAIRDLRHIWINENAGRPWLVIAHEIGHLVLNTDAHLDEGQWGVMSPTPRHITEEFTFDDKDFACAEAGICW